MSAKLEVTGSDNKMPSISGKCFVCKADILCCSPIIEPPLPSNEPHRNGGFPPTSVCQPAYVSNEVNIIPSDLLSNNFGNVAKTSPPTPGIEGNLPSEAKMPPDSDYGKPDEISSGPSPRKVYPNNGKNQEFNNAVEQVLTHCSSERTTVEASLRILNLNLGYNLSDSVKALIQAHGDRVAAAEFLKQGLIA
ncbi:hypothetical protein ACTXT7_013938 [Hymenolepis weldensis]